MIRKINDLQAEELRLFTGYSEVQLLRLYEPAPGVFVAESPRVIERALAAGYEPISFLLEEKHEETQAAGILKAFPQVPAYCAPFEVLTELTGFQLTRGMLAAMRRKALPAVSEISGNATRIAVLENVENPTNLGAIFRCAAALGMDAVLLSAGCCDPLYRRAERVSMGTVFQIPWTFLPGPAEKGAAEGVKMLKNQGFHTVAMALREDSCSIDDPAVTGHEKLAVVLGTEGDGLLEKTIGACDHTVMIPMSHGVDSLNVAAAGAVAFWELGKRK